MTDQIIHPYISEMFVFYPIAYHLTLVFESRQTIMVQERNTCPSHRCIASGKYHRLEIVRYVDEICVRERGARYLLKMRACASMDPLHHRKSTARTHTLLKLSHRTHGGHTAGTPGTDVVISCVCARIIVSILHRMWRAADNVGGVGDETRTERLQHVFYLITRTGRARRSPPPPPLRSCGLFTAGSFIRAGKTKTPAQNTRA